MDRTTKLRDSITTLIASNFELVHMKSKFVEGIQIEKTRVGFCSKLRNPSVMGNNPNQEVWGVNPDFKSYQQKWTIHGIFQHMGFYPPTENPNVMMRENLKTKSCEYIIIYHDELYMVSTTPQEILHMLQGKYKINIYLEPNFPHDPGGRDICQIKEYLEEIYTNVNMLFKDDLPRYLHIAFEIIKLLIKKGNLNLIHNKITYQHFNDLSRKRKLDKLYNAV